MNEDLLELERELAGLKPRAPSSRLARALETEMNAAVASRPRTATTWTSWKWVNWSVAAALVALMALASSLQPPRSPAAGPSRGYVPIAAERTVYDAADEGLVVLTDGQSGRKFRSRFVDTITWQDPVTRASLRWSVPREEVRVVPVRAN